MNQLNKLSGIAQWFHWRPSSFISDSQNSEGRFINSDLLLCALTIFEILWKIMSNCGSAKSVKKYCQDY